MHTAACQAVAELISEAAFQTSDYCLRQQRPDRTHSADKAAIGSQRLPFLISLNFVFRLRDCKKLFVCSLILTSSSAGFLLLLLSKPLQPALHFVVLRAKSSLPSF